MSTDPIDMHKFTPVDKKIEAEDIHFKEYCYPTRPPLFLAHFLMPDGLRFEVSRLELYAKMGYYYSVMRIETTGERDYYLLQHTIDAVAAIINQELP